MEEIEKADPSAGESSVSQEEGRRRDGYKTIDKTNDSFFEFYRQQAIIPADEWDLFVETLRTPLASSFRIQLSLPERDRLEKHLQEAYFAKLSSADGDESLVPKAVPFIPYAYQLDVRKKEFKTNPTLKKFHEFIVNETAIGNISRQEVVSMVPPLLLDIQPHHNVLDACAAPGSKTTQIIELMHENSTDPEGMLVANDIDYNRCYLLVHQTLKRMPTANCVVTNHDATMFPQLMDESGKSVLFDRILCDAICSGDGTFRKNPELWMTWDAGKCLDLHKLQRRIAHRCVELLGDDGLMIYSTCSLNPIEDEAVVADLLRTFKEKLELVDVSDKLPELKRQRGRSAWKVFSKNLQEFDSVSSVPEPLKRAIVPTMFPPTQEEADEMHLERSFRILPHAQNSGGFFVAVLRRVGAIDAKGYARPMGRETRKRKAMREDPFKFLKDDNELKAELEEHFGMQRDTFPYERLVTRSSNKDKNNVFYINDRIRALLKANEGRLRVINAGIGVLKRTEKFSLCSYRLKQDGIHLIVPHVKKRIIELDTNDVISILAGSNGNHQVPLASLSGRAALTAQRSGSVVLQLTLPGTTIRKSICAWLGAHTISPFISREERAHMLCMLGADYDSSLQSKAAGKKPTTGDAPPANGDPKPT